MQHRHVAALMGTLTGLTGPGFWYQLAAVELTIAELDPHILALEMDDLVALIDPRTVGERLTARANLDQTPAGFERRTVWDSYMAHFPQLTTALAVARPAPAGATRFGAPQPICTTCTTAHLCAPAHVAPRTASADPGRLVVAPGPGRRGRRGSPGTWAQRDTRQGASRAVSCAAPVEGFGLVVWLATGPVWWRGPVTASPRATRAATWDRGTSRRNNVSTNASATTGTRYQKDGASADA